MSVNLIDGPLLQVEDLSVEYTTNSGVTSALRDVSLDISQGQILGVVGESGSGKSTLAHAVMRYLPSSGHIRKGTIRFQGSDLGALTLEDMRRIWGAAISLIPQDPGSALNPSIPIGEQIGEVLRLHLRLDRTEASGLCLDWIEKVGLSEPHRVSRSYPHQLSGGMQQRVMIAMALCTEPALLLLDEPTSNLDMTSQAGILDLLIALMEGQETAALYITHTLGVVAQICDELAVLYAGEIVERGSTRELFKAPHHPYTRALLDSVPRLGKNKRQVRVHAIQGRIPSLEALPSGCIFRERCPLAIELCNESPPLYETGRGRKSRCHRWEEIAAGEIDPRQPITEDQMFGRVARDDDPVLKVDGLVVRYERSSPIKEWSGKVGVKAIRAVDGVSIQIKSGETLGLVGESGSGKTTSARAIMGLLVPDSGDIRLLGEHLAPELRKRPIQIRRLLQMVFQDPAEALNPYLTIGESLSRPFIRLMRMSAREAAVEVARLLESVRLPGNFADRLPGALSGGERQRVALARAFASTPELLLVDEAVSGLDVSVQAVILNLLGELQAVNGSAMLFISHDLAAVGYIADRIAVIYRGQLMQISRSEQLFLPPYHPYTEALISAIPLLDPEATQERIRLSDDAAAGDAGGRGCPFESRCPRRIGERCREETPPWHEGPEGTRIFCHIPPDELAATQSHLFRFSWESRDWR